MTKHIEIPTSIRFAATAAVFLLACYCLLERSVGGAAACFGINIFFVPRAFPDLSDSAMRRWLLGAALRLVIILVVVGIVYFHPPLTPATFERSTSWSLVDWRPATSSRSSTRACDAVTPLPCQPMTDQ